MSGSFFKGCESFGERIIIWFNHFSIGFNWLCLIAFFISFILSLEILFSCSFSFNLSYNSSNFYSLFLISISHIRTSLFCYPSYSYNFFFIFSFASFNFSELLKIMLNKNKKLKSIWMNVIYELIDKQRYYYSRSGGGCSRNKNKVQRATNLISSS